MKKNNENGKSTDGKLSLKREKIAILGTRTGIKAGLEISGPTNCSRKLACIQ